MTTNGTHNESAPAGTGAPSGQISALDTRDDSTSLATLQYHIGPIRLKARPSGKSIALQILPPNGLSAALLTLHDAINLAAALKALVDELTDDWAADARARDWSKRMLERIIAQADGSAESYHSKL